MGLLRLPVQVILMSACPPILTLKFENHCSISWPLARAVNLLRDLHNLCCASGRYGAANTQFPEGSLKMLLLLVQDNMGL